MAAPVSRPTRARGDPTLTTAVRMAMRAAASVVGHQSRLKASTAVAEAATRLVGATRAIVFLDLEAIRAFDAVPTLPVRVPETLVVAAAVGGAALHIGVHFTIADNLVGEAIKRKRCVSDKLVRGASMGTSAPSSSLWSDVPDATAVPLIVRRRVIGALAVTHAGPDGLDWSRRQTLTDFARVAAAGLVAACQYEEAVRQAIADPLTGLLNRTGFDRRLREELDRNHRTTKIGGALVVMDLDNFKHVNDTWGHLVGDAVVRIVAHDAIRSQIRSYDVPCRIGGDEFAVILPHTDLHHAVAVADRLRRAVADAPTDTVGVPRGTVGASLGVVSFTAGGVGPDDILDRADRIMYRAKRRGRNLVLADHTE